MANPQNIVDHKFQPGQSGNPKGRPKGRKSLSTMVRDLLESEIDWKKLPLKNTEEFRKKFGDKPLAGEVLIRSAYAEAMGKGGTAAREWLRKSGYGDKLALGGDEDNPVPILTTLKKDVPGNESAQEDRQPDQTNQGSSGRDGGGEDRGDTPVPDKPSPDQK